MGKPFKIENNHLMKNSPKYDREIHRAIKIKCMLLAYVPKKTLFVPSMIFFIISDADFTLKTGLK